MAASGYKIIKNQVIRTAMRLAMRAASPVLAGQLSAV
jgi:hypothetical protein